MVEEGPLDHLALDYLAEVTMSILQKQKQADPLLGCSRDFPPRDRGLRQGAVTSVRLTADGENRVRVTRIRGGPRPPSLKLSISYANGWKAIGTLVYSWPPALEKARVADAIVRQRLRNLGLTFDEIYTEYFGVNACRGPVAPPNPDPPEAQLRVGVRGADRKAVDRFTRELIPLVLNGPPGATGFGEVRPVVREIVAYWPALLPREEIVTRVEVVE
jgi:hypothetical protein